MMTYQYLVFLALDYIHPLTIFIYYPRKTDSNCELGTVTYLSGSSLKEQRGTNKGETLHVGKCKDVSMLCFSLTEPHPRLVHPCPLLVKMPRVADTGPTILFVSPV